MAGNRQRLLIGQNSTYRLGDNEGCRRFQDHHQSKVNGRAVAQGVIGNDGQGIIAVINGDHIPEAGINGIVIDTDRICIDHKLQSADSGRIRGNCGEGSRFVQGVAADQNSAVDFYVANLGA